MSFSFISRSLSDCDSPASFMDQSLIAAIKPGSLETMFRYSINEDAPKETAPSHNFPFSDHAPTLEEQKTELDELKSKPQSGTTPVVIEKPQSVYDLVVSMNELIKRNIRSDTEIESKQDKTEDIIRKFYGMNIPEAILKGLIEIKCEPGTDEKLSSRERHAIHLVRRDIRQKIKSHVIFDIAKQLKSDSSLLPLAENINDLICALYDSAQQFKAYPARPRRYDHVVSIIRKIHDLIVDKKCSQRNSLFSKKNPDVRSNPYKKHHPISMRARSKRNG